MYDQPGQRAHDDLLAEVGRMNSCRHMLWEILQYCELPAERRQRAIKTLADSGWFDDMMNAEWHKDQMSKNPKDREGGGRKRFLTEDGKVVDWGSPEHLRELGKE